MCKYFTPICENHPRALKLTPPQLYSRCPLALAALTRNIQPTQASPTAMTSGPVPRAPTTNHTPETCPAKSHIGTLAKRDLCRECNGAANVLRRAGRRLKLVFIGMEEGARAEIEREDEDAFRSKWRDEGEDESEEEMKRERMARAEIGKVGSAEVWRREGVAKARLARAKFGKRFRRGKGVRMERIEEGEEVWAKVRRGSEEGILEDVGDEGPAEDKDTSLQTAILGMTAREGTKVSSDGKPSGTKRSLWEKIVKKATKKK